MSKFEFALQALIAFILIFTLGSSSATARPLTTIASFLKDDRGANLAAMGGTGTAVNGDLFSVMANPASLAGLDRYQAVFEHEAMFLDISGNYASVGGPYGDHFAFGFGYNGIDYGSTIRTTVADPFGSSNSSFTGGDQAISLSAGYRTGYYNNIYLGAAYRYFVLDIDNFNAHGHAVDLGAQWDVWFRGASGLRLGVSLLNLGFATSFRNASEDLPTTWRLGATYRDRIAGFKINGSADVVGGHGEEIHGLLGLAVWPVDWMAVRAGYNGQRDFASGFSGGLGFLWNDVNVDYAYIPYGDFGANHRVSLGYSWGSPRQPVGPYARSVAAQTAVEGEVPRRMKYVPSPPEPEEFIPEEEPVPSTKRASRVVAPQAAPAEPAPDRLKLIELAPSTRRSEPAPQSGPVVLRRAPAPPAPVAPAAPTRTAQVEVKELLRQAAGMMEQERYSEAVDIYNKAVTANPENTRAIYNMATAQFLMKDYSTAGLTYKRVIERQTNDAESWFYLGLCQFKLGDDRNAVTSWKRTLALDPSNEDAKSYLSSMGELF